MDRAERIQDGDFFPSSSKRQRYASPAPSSVSVKSISSKHHPLNIKDEGCSSEHESGLVSPVPSHLSMKSNWYKHHPLNIKDEECSSEHEPGLVSPVPSHLSMKSNSSIDYLLNFKDEGCSSEHDYNLRPESVSSVSSHLSMKSNSSIDYLLNFKDGKMQPGSSKMAEGRISVDQNEFLCPVCLDLLKDPVAIPCGHSYCKSCITDCWDQEDQKRVYSCPQCRQTFSPRPALYKSTMLAEVVKKLKKRKLPADCYTGAEDVQCDVCTGRKHKAVKSCLVCLESYCQNHLEQHESLLKRNRHNLTDATGRLQEMICLKHNKILEVFCRTDQKVICVLCPMDEHKNHITVSAAAERTKKQHQLKETQRWFQQRIHQREKDLHQLREAVESHKTAVEDSERIFTELIRSIERSRSEATQRIRDQEKTAVSRAEGRLERLEQEINDLRRRDTELEQLSHTQNRIHFLQSFQSLSAPPESTDVNDDPFSSLSSFDVVREFVRQLRDKLEDFCKEELKKISDRVSFTNIVLRTRNDFLQYSHQLTLDLNTVNKRLRLSKKNRVITRTGTELQPYPDHPDRFDECNPQVLCRESMFGRCYWEIEWSGVGVLISVSYKSIRRKGGDNKCWFGYNDQSWSLFCSSSSYSFRHNKIETKLPVKSISSRIGVYDEDEDEDDDEDATDDDDDYAAAAAADDDDDDDADLEPSSRRIGVYVDHSAGTLSFYSVSGDTMILIHTVQTTFTQPLYPGFGVYNVGSSVKLC
ncbi:tripartite motif-containing protein 16-like isoform X2 [Chanodichthys erythropterus]|uniref:tripartite motif-containing protein 16-like isoform X2 n=1 Tax=Chanodichthys erythropterus TaxID=933992 RepID=UPI00351F7D55